MIPHIVVTGPSNLWDLLAWVAVAAALVMGVVNLLQLFADAPPARPRRERPGTNRPSSPGTPPRSAP